jgi:polysaccharide biosynthesis protein PslG
MRLSHHLAVMLVAALLFALPSPAAALQRGVDTDLTWGIPDQDFAPTQAAITDIGAQWVRLTILWNEGEPQQKGSYNTKTLNKWDKAVATAQAAGANIVATVGRSPSWASGSTNQYMPPQDPADYADFVSFLANRYEGKVDVWEIWNEQNSTRFWPTGPDAAEYTRLLQAAYPAVKAADPAALVAFGGLAYSDFFYVGQAYKAGVKGYFDIMATHPYSDQYSPEYKWYAAPGVLTIKSFDAYREVRRRMLVNGDDKPIWFTEFGWSSCTTAARCVTSEQQASYLTRALCMMEQDPYVQVALWYNLRNNHWNDDLDSWETQLGLMKTTFERKPSYDAFKNYDPSACPPPADAPAAPEPTPEFAPEPEATDSSQADPTDTDGEIGGMSTIRRRTTTVLRWKQGARVAGPRTVRRVPARSPSTAASSVRSAGGSR